MKKLFLSLLIFLLLGPCCIAEKLEIKEKEYQRKFCADHGGQLEVVTPDGARIDCVTKAYAIEVDFAHKWAESIGQALYYALITNKKPGILLIISDYKKEKQFLKRLKAVTEKYNIKVWTIHPRNL